MKRIFRNIIPYWKSVLLIVLLLTVQAYCDLALPQYTADIIDTGITGKGVEHIAPERITAEEFREAQVFMEEEEAVLWNEIYVEDGADYRLNAEDEKVLEEVDEKLITAVALTYQLGHMREGDFKDTIKEAVSQNPQMAELESKIDDMSIEEIETLMGTDIDSFQAEDEEGNVSNYVDMRPLMERMIAEGQMDEAAIRNART